MRRYLLPLFLLLVSLVPPASAQTIGSTVPNNAIVLAGADSSNQLVGVKLCDQTAAFSVTLTSTTPMQIIAGVTSKKVYVCGFFISAGADASVAFYEGNAGGSCAAGQDVTGLAKVTGLSGFTLSPAPFAVAFSAVPGNGICVKQSGAGSVVVSGWISYTQQ